MRILAIDTAGPVVGAALVSIEAGSPPQVLGHWSERVVQGADGRLVPAIDEMIRGAGGPPAVERVVVSVGPGAFTGLRVGVATALGYALALGVAVVPLSSLAARAAMARGPRVLAMLDAKKSRVYAGFFDCSGDVPRALGPEVDLPAAQIWPQPPFLVVGEGGCVLREQVEAAGGELVGDADLCPVLALARLAAHKDAVALDPGEIALRYLRPPDARPPADLETR